VYLVCHCRFCHNASHWARAFNDAGNSSEYAYGDKAYGILRTVNIV